MEMPDNWLNLSEVSKLLGIHPSTVRNWSDQGLLPVHRTQGGHRRYLRSELELWMQSQRASGPSEVDLMVQSGVRNIRFQISEGHLNEEAWYAKLDDEARVQYRSSGRTLVQGLIGYLGSNSGEGRAQAEGLGYEYAARGRRCGLSVVEATHAFLFFRNLLVESLMETYESASIRSPSAWSEMFRKLTAFTDRILITLLETYEAYERGNR
jgi:excisionase family DNA binding protein